VGILCETLEKAQHWMITVENRVACIAHESRTLLTGMTALVALYFVFNLKYQSEAEATLEFIQRFVFGNRLRSKWEPLLA